MPEYKFEHVKGGPYMVRSMLYKFEYVRGGAPEPGPYVGPLPEETDKHE